MRARYEQKKIIGNAPVSVTDYINLANLPHWHTEHELIYVISGTAEVMVNNALYTINEGMSIFASSEEIHYIRSENGSSVRVVKIDPVLIKGIAGNHILKNPVIENFYHIKEKTDNVLKELNDGRKYCDIIAGSIVTQLIAEIFRSEETLHRTSDKGGINEKYKELLKLISEKYAFITFEEAADFMCLSQPYFSKYFHRMSGMTFTRYLNVVRVSAAAEMLSQGNLSVTEIASRCGFGTIRSFNRVFRELTGSSPTSLPENFVIIRSEQSESGFDPTLSTSVRL